MAFRALGSWVVIVGFHFGDAWRGFGVDFVGIGEIALGECFGDVLEVHADVVAAGRIGGIVGLDLDDSSRFCEGEVMGGFGLVEAHYLGAACVHGCGVVWLLLSGSGCTCKEEQAYGYCCDSAG